MTLPLDELIARLKKLERRATPGPWHSCLDRDKISLVAGGASCAEHKSYIFRTASNGRDADAIAQLRNLLPEIIERLEKKGAEL